ncbi:MAG TPA: hypothetical protein VGJ22_07860, partial [Anaerolineales bacterium]
MDLKTQLNGLNDFLTAIHGEETSLESLLESLDFEAAQVKLLREQRLEAVAGQFIEVVRKRLTWEEKDLWYRVLARRFGLDGEPGAAIDGVAAALGIEPSHAAYAEAEAMHKCRYTTNLQDFRKELPRLALNELSNN